MRFNIHCGILLDGEVGGAAEPRPSSSAKKLSSACGCSDATAAHRGRTSLRQNRWPSAACRRQPSDRRCVVRVQRESKTTYRQRQDDYAHVFHHPSPLLSSVRLHLVDASKPGVDGDAITTNFISGLRRFPPTPTADRDHSYNPAMSLLRCGPDEAHSAGHR